MVDDDLMLHDDTYIGLGQPFAKPTGMRLRASCGRNGRRENYSAQRTPLMNVPAKSVDESRSHTNFPVAAADELDRGVSECTGVTRSWMIAAKR